MVIPLQWLTIGIATLLLWVMVVRRFRKWASLRVAVTNHRVLVSYRRRQQGWDIPVLSIIDVSGRSGLVQRIFRVGTLTIRTNFAQQSAVVVDVPQVIAARDLILRSRDEAWAGYQWNMARQSDQHEIRTAS